MIDAFVNVCFGLALKAFDDGLLLIKLKPVNQALKFELFESLLDLPKWKLYSIELRTVRDYKYPREAQLSHPVFHRCRLVRGQVVHYDRQLLAFVDLSKSLEKCDEVLLIYRFRIQSEALETASFTDCCKNSRVLCTE